MLKTSAPTIDLYISSNSPSTCLIGTGNLCCVEITELLLQESTRPLEAHGYFESRLLSETLDDSIKAHRGDLFVWSSKVHKQNNLCAAYYGLLQLQSGSANANVAKHPLDFRLVVCAI
jgi:hypothetical protein